MTFWAILSVVLQIGVLLLIWFLQRAGTGYAERKGQNLATKQDIGEITDRIKSVESKHELSLEIQKNQLQRYSDSALANLQLKNRALLEFFDDCIQLFGEKLRTNLGDLPANDGGKAVFQHVADTKAMFRKVFVDYHRLLLFLRDDEKILQEGSKVITSVLELEEVYNKHITGIRIALNQETEAHQFNHERYPQKVNETDAVKTAFDKEMIAPLSKFRKTFMAYVESIQESLSIGNTALADIARQQTDRGK